MMIDRKHFLAGLTCQAGAFTMDKKRIEAARDVYGAARRDIRAAWKAVGEAAEAAGRRFRT